MTSLPSLLYLGDQCGCCLMTSLSSLLYLGDHAKGRHISSVSVNNVNNVNNVNSVNTLVGGGLGAIMFVEKIIPSNNISYCTSGNLKPSE